MTPDASYKIREEMREDEWPDFEKRKFAGLDNRNPPCARVPIV